MAFNNPCSKLERAVQNYLILQGKGTIADTYICDFSGERILPNRTIAAVSFSPKRKFRPEGRCQLRIEHHFPAIEQPGDDANSQRVQKNEYVGETYDSMLVGDAESLNKTADYITLAGRDLAIDHSSGANPDMVKRAEDNADMADFRCDWIEQADPFLTRGRPNQEGSFWVEVLIFNAFVSNATATN